MSSKEETRIQNKEETDKIGTELDKLKKIVEEIEEVEEKENMIRRINCIIGRYEDMIEELAKEIKEKHKDELIECYAKTIKEILEGK